MEKIKERRVWKTGKGSFVTSLPKKWAENLTDERIIVSNYKKGLILTPVEEIRHKVGRLSVSENEPKELVYDLISAYLNNFREIQVEFSYPYKECIDTLESMPQKLLGVSISFASKNNFLVEMSTRTKPIPEILDQMLSQCQAIHETNQKAMSTFRLSLDHIQEVEAIENDIDRNSFLVKRLFCVAATHPTMAGQVGINDLSETLHLQTLNSNLERVGDLQREVTRELEYLFETFKNKVRNMIYSDEMNYGFRDYLDSAQMMVNDAYSNDHEKINDILKTKSQRVGRQIVRHREKYITKNEGETIEKLTRGNQDLTCLDVRIWGLTGHATNIAEAWLNKRGPKVLE